MKITVFHDTRHSFHRGHQRQIKLTEMIAVLTAPDSQRQQMRGEHGGFVYLFTRRLGGRQICVVAEVKKTECWIVTAYEN